MKAWIAFASLVLATFSPRAFGLELSALNQRLKAANAGWVAKDYSKDNPTQRQFGLQLDDDPAVLFEIPEMKTSLSADRLDWRNHQGQNWISPIVDQGGCGSCVSFASIGTLESQYKISLGFSRMNVKFSTQHLFACGGGRCHFGWTPEKAAKYMKTSGVTDEACLPYTSGATGNDVTCNQACADSGARLLKLSDYQRPTKGSRDLEAVKSALAKGPLVTTMHVYEDFVSYSSGIYKHVTGKFLGGHAISIVGYDDSERAFIVRNSWGEDWGEKGYFRVSYDDTSGIGGSTWYYDILPSTNVSVESPVDRASVSGTLPVQLATPNRELRSYILSIYNARGELYFNGPASMKMDLDISGFPDGRYEMEVSGFDGAGQKVTTTQRRYFYVANAEPALKLDFTLSKESPVSGNVMMNINGSSSTVPMTDIEFHSKLVGEEAKTRTADFPANSLVMKWKTALIKNGTYEIWMVGRVRTNQKTYSVETPHRTVEVKN